MFEFLFFIACVWAIVFVFLKLKRRFFNPFIESSKVRLAIWNWTKRIVLLSLSASLLFATFERWYYFHDEIAYSKKSLEVNLSYAGQVEVEAYITTKENIVTFFEGKQPSSNLSRKHGSDCVRYKVIRLKNNGSLPIYGTLVGKNPDDCRKLDIPPLPPHMEDFKSIVLWEPLRVQDEFYHCAKVDVEWERIYTLKGDKK